MKKNLRILLIVLIGVFLSLSMFGCEYESEYQKNLKRIFETEYFRCINYEGEDAVTILELTELGKEQEVLVIPAEMKGMRVSQLGGEIRGALLYGSGRLRYQPSFAHLKKIYLLGNIEWIDLTSSKDFISSNTVVITMANQEALKKSNLLDQCVVSSQDDQGFPNYHKNNVEYHFNYENNEKPYFIDLINETIQEYLLPATPRREGYSFVCWCKDKEGVEVWNETFDYSEKELKLYAKWTKK